MTAPHDSTLPEPDAPTHPTDAEPEAGVDVPAAGTVGTDVAEREYDAAPVPDAPTTAVRGDERTALVIGEALVDAVRTPDGAVTEHVGGSPANVALGLGRLGRDVHLLTWIGDDERGRTVRRHLEASGVTVVPGSDSAPRTSVATALLDDSGVATYDFDLTWEIPGRWTAPAGAPLVVHTGSIAAVLPPGGEDVARIVQAHRQSATITYDPNLRPSLMGTPESARGVVEHLVTLSDVVKVSDEDLAWLHPDEDPTQVARRWATAGPALVVVTRGGDGATAVTSSGHELDVAAPPVTVADTVGAGDSFMSGLVDGLWSAGLLGADRREGLHHAEEGPLRSVLTRCVEIAAITVGRPGADPPTAAELAPR